MSFYWYNQRVIQMYLKAKFQNPEIKEHKLGSDAFKKLNQINRCFSEHPFGLMNDSTGHISHPFNIAIKSPYQYAEENRSFGQVCIDTAQLISTMSDRTISVFWSGGIDSTSALVALLQTVDHNRLIVVCNQASIDEFPSFYKEKIQNKVRTMSPATAQENYKEFFSVTGDGGDTVWGVVDQSFWDRDQDKIQLPWQDCIDKTIVTDMDFVEEFCKWSGVEIKTWMDLRIWFYLCCKWQDKSIRPYHMRTNLTSADTVAFYDVDSSFQHWTMNNLHNIIGPTWKDYKMPAKQFIYQYHPDLNYLQTKSKENSMSLDKELVTKTLLNQRIVVGSDFSDYHFKLWPFFDFAEFEDFNDLHELIPHSLLG